MIFGLDEAGALARVSYHAQELSLLTSRTNINPREIISVKMDLEKAFRDLFDLPTEKHELN